MTSPQAGQVIKGKYRIDRVLGEGGMGVVVAAHHVALDQRVAIKFLLPAMLSHPDVVDRFAREARAASKIESEHVARVMDVDTFEDGAPFMVMEYLEGSDLSSVRQSGRALPAHVAVDYILQACEAIGEAHRMGIVHRDLKPANLFLARRSDGRVRVKVLDFGISKMNAGLEASVTKTTAVMGSCEYMSPEQMLSSRDADVRSDIWALGVTLYELVTAHVPFPGETITQVCALVMEARPSPPRAFQPELPPALEQIILRCLARDRNYRFGSVGELAMALLPFAPGHAAPRSSSGVYDPVSYGGQPHMGSSPGFGIPQSNPQVGGFGIAQSNPHAAGFALAQSNPHVGPGGPITNAIVSRTSPSVGKSRAWLFVAIFGVLGLGAIGGVFALRGSSEGASAASASAAPATAPAPPPTVAETAAATTATAQPSAAVTAAATAAPETTAEPSAEPSTAAAPTTAAPARGTPHRNTKPNDKPAPPAMPAAKPRNLGF